MELSIFVAKVISLIYLPLGIALLGGQLKGKEIIDSFKKSPGLSILVGCIGLIIGIFLITYHNIWIKDWPVLITIFGWAAAIEGIVFIGLPKLMFSITNVIPKNEKLWGFIALILGLVFGYFGFIA